MYILPIEHCQQHEAPDVLFLKDMHDLGSHVFFIFFLLHVPHQVIRCDLCMLTDYCSYQVSFSTTLSSSQGEQSYLKLFPRHFSISLHSFEAPILSAEKLTQPQTHRDLSVCLACLLYTALPWLMKTHFLFSSKYWTVSKMTSHSTTTTTSISLWEQ